MAVPSGSARVTLYGGLQGGEVWSASYGINVGSGQTQATINALASQAFQQFKTLVLPTAQLAYFPTTTTFLGARAYYYAGGTTAQYVGQSPDPSTAGTATSAGLPNQCALVVTMLTGRAGRSYRGRMYLPAPASGVLAATQLGSSQLNVLTTNLQSYFNAMNTFTAPATGVGVISSKLSSISDLSSIRIDSRLDVQRGRAQKQTVASVATAAIT